MGRITLNGLSARLNGLEKIVEVYIKEIKDEIIEIKDGFKSFQDNDLYHMRQDIDGLKKIVYKFMGGIAVLVIIIEVLARVVE